MRRRGGSGHEPYGRCLPFLRRGWNGAATRHGSTTLRAGPVHYHLYAGDAIERALHSLCGLRLKASGAGMFSYYGTGDFLALHRDIVGCDVAVITWLERVAPSFSNYGGRLQLFSGQLRKSLPEIAADPAAAPVELDLQPGETIVLAGGTLAHRVSERQPGEQRIV